MYDSFSEIVTPNVFGRPLLSVINTKYRQAISFCSYCQRDEKEQGIMDKSECKERVTYMYAELCLLMDCPSVADPDSGFRDG